MASSSWPVFCDSPELAAEILTGLGKSLPTVAAEVATHPFSTAIAHVSQQGACGVLMFDAPEIAAFVELAHACRVSRQIAAVAFLEQSDAADALVGLAADLGIVCVRDSASLLACIALLQAGAKQPWRASLRSLSVAEKSFLASAMEPASNNGELLSHNDSLLAWRQSAQSEAHLIGGRRETRAALLAHRQAQSDSAPTLATRFRTTVIDKEAVQEVLFGPPRALSDPASKAALRPYGVPLPEEELCSSPSRTASEAARMGFPVRIALASPDLRAWDHPDLVVTGVDNASRAKEIFQQIMSQARDRAPDARLLGVTVSATRGERALLRVRCTALPHDLVLLQLGFADPHGVAAGDLIVSYLPNEPARLERALQRLRGYRLLVNEDDRRHQGHGALMSLLDQLGAFIQDHQQVVDSLELNPVALLLDGSIEIREACVAVGEAYSRALHSA